VNDGLMVIFFFLMGLEIKRELVHGELSSVRRALLPATAALGGMIAPALIYTLFNAGSEGAHGWGVPVATDIAFALGVLSLLGRRVPFSVRVFLLALAIADDIGGILVIAIFYTSHIDLVAMGVAALILVAVFASNRIGIRSFSVYIVLGVLLWLAVHESGIHATIAGVALGLMTPATGHDAITEVDSSPGQSPPSEAPLERLERALVGWVSFLIVPMFALANAGVEISGDVARDALSSSISHGVTLGLVLGKPIGIFVFTFVAVKLRLCDMPRGANWAHLFGVGILGGIGFTVALLITDLGFRNDPLLVDEAKIGVLAGSAAAGLLGFIFLFLIGRTGSGEGDVDPELNTA
jgi:NhaA family Na+:H+ antiporter